MLTVSSMCGHSNDAKKPMNSNPMEPKTFLLQQLLIMIRTLKTKHRMNLSRDDTSHPAVLGKQRSRQQPASLSHSLHQTSIVLVRMAEMHTSNV